MEKDAYGVRKLTNKILSLIRAEILFVDRISDLHIHCPGQPGHGSLLLNNTAGEKVAYILNKFYEFRESEKKKLKDNPEYTIGDVTTVNLTQIHVSDWIL